MPSVLPVTNLIPTTQPPDRSALLLGITVFLQKNPLLYVYCTDKPYLLLTRCYLDSNSLPLRSLGWTKLKRSPIQSSQPSSRLSVQSTTIIPNASTNDRLTTRATTYNWGISQFHVVSHSLCSLRHRMRPGMLPSALWIHYHRVSARRGHATRER